MGVHHSSHIYIVEGLKWRGDNWEWIVPRLVTHTKYTSHSHCVYRSVFHKSIVLTKFKLSWYYTLQNRNFHCFATEMERVSSGHLLFSSGKCFPPLTLILLVFWLALCVNTPHALSSILRSEIKIERNSMELLTEEQRLCVSIALEGHNFAILGQVSDFFFLRGRQIIEP